MKMVVNASQIRKVYGVKGNVYTALDDIDLTVQEGEFVESWGRPAQASRLCSMCLRQLISLPREKS